jgi:hypothetical protein
MSDSQGIGACNFRGSEPKLKVVTILESTFKS